MVDVAEQDRRKSLDMNRKCILVEYRPFHHTPVQLEKPMVLDVGGTCVRESAQQGNENRDGVVNYWADSDHRQPLDRPDIFELDE